MKRLIWPAIIIISSILYMLFNLFGGQSQSPVRAFIAFWFMLICPGMAFVRLFHIRGWVFEWTLAVALSITLGTLVTEIAVVNQLWSPGLDAFILAALAIYGAVVQVILNYRAEPQ